MAEKNLQLRPDSFGRFIMALSERGTEILHFPNTMKAQLPFGQQAAATPLR